jgi:uroporphyrinogen-III synthase
MTEKPLSGIGIAITRPTDQANKLAKLIRDAGGAPVLFPLIEIAPLSDYSQFETVISKISNYDWAIFISSNAVQNGMPRLLKLGLIKQGVPDNLQFAAIGPVTSQALIEFGITNVLTPLSHIQDDDKNKARFDSESLLALPEMVDVNNKKVMIFRGQGGREILAETLKKRGAQVAFAECYQRINPQTDCNLLTQLYAENKMHGIVITSSEAMRHLLDLAGSLEWLHNVTLFVNHARIAELPTQKGLKVKVADALGDEAMIKNLISHLTLKT